MVKMLIEEVMFYGHYEIKMNFYSEILFSKGDFFTNF